MTNKSTKLFFCIMLIILALPIICSIIIGFPSVFNWLQHNLIPPSKLKPVYYCPAPTIVNQYKKANSAWSDQSLSWSVEYQGWKAPAKILFMQALIAKRDNSLKCYYQWPDPKQPSTWLWLVIKFNPQATQLAQPYGQHWESRGSVKQCSAGDVKTCAFYINDNS